MNAKERGSGVDVVQGCFPGGGDSILSAFSWEPLRVNLQDYELTSFSSWLTKSHDQPGHAHALWCLQHDVDSN